MLNRIGKIVLILSLILSVILAAYYIHLVYRNSLAGEINERNHDKSPTPPWDDQDSAPPVDNQASSPTPAQAGDIWLLPGIEMKLVRIPATTVDEWKRLSGSRNYFLMGSPEASTAAKQKAEAWRNIDEVQHPVILTHDFWLGQFEVTQGQYSLITGANPAGFTSVGSDAPVENVTWRQANDYCNKLEEWAISLGILSIGDEVRLPSEAEWEYACRAGTTTAFHYGDELDASKANFNGNFPYGNEIRGEYREETMPVGSFAPNAWGLYDMHGNVWEWCRDWYGDYPLGMVTDPTGPNSGSGRVARGGSWLYNARLCRAAFRNYFSADYASNAIGFRVVVVCGM